MTCETREVERGDPINNSTIFKENTMKYLGNVNGGYSPVVRSFPSSGATLTKGMALTYTAGAATVSKFSTDTGIAMIGIANEDVASTDTSIEVILTPNGTMIESAVEELAQQTTFVASIGTATELTLNSLWTGITSGANDTLIGAIFTVKSSATVSNGTAMTVTDYVQTASQGIITFATTTTSLAASDTVVLTKLPTNGRMIGLKTLGIYETDCDTIVLKGTGAGGGTWLNVIGTSDDGLNVVGVLTSGIDATDAIVA
jgi:hypothetical protein